MIIDSKKYNGKCACGHEHKMTTEFCIIEVGCLVNIDKYIEKCGLKGHSVAIYDENTYNATKQIHPKVDKEIILPPENLHADNHGVALAKELLPENCDYLIAIGSGTIHDITRYCAYEKGISFVSCPTAASVDGFCSSVAAMTWDGFKKTFEAVAPKIVIADLSIISKAPMFLTNSGFGDMIGKFIALADWKVAHTLTNEYFCDTIHNMTMDATKAVTESAEAIKDGDITAYENLIYGLLMSGLAMQMLGNSRCASGAEHHISHLIEMQPEGLGVKSDALHGEKVGVGTLIACREYHRLKDSNLKWNDYHQPSSDYIKDMFGEKLNGAIIAENSDDCALGITAKLIEEKWDKIRNIIDTIPTYSDLIEKYEILGVKSKLGDIDVSEEKLDALMKYSPLVRNRLTLMRLKRAIKNIYQPKAKMKKYLLPNEGNFYKANLHCHSNLSDGVLSPKELKELYKAHGYSVLAYTDHDIFIPHNELTDDGFVALSGFEAQFNGNNKYPGVPNEKKCHMCIIAGTPNIVKQPCWNEEYAYIGNVAKNKDKVKIDEKTSDFVREYSHDGISKMMKICRDKGFFITYNHPSWSLENYEQYINYDGMHALEIFNYSCELLGYQSYAPGIYDDILKSGKKIFAVAADDNHNKSRPDSCGGFVMIKAKKLKYEAITEALFNGDFYSSTGPEIYKLYVEDNKVHIKCSDAVMISLTTDRRFSKCIWQEDGKFITEAVFDLNCECEYFRITVKDINGNHANTNAYFTEAI